jgi:ornithine cyclodeaminase/alanine dehydrogenase-like protein (mu-crystallin family)
MEEQKHTDTSNILSLSVLWVELGLWKNTWVRKGWHVNKFGGKLKKKLLLHNEFCAKKFFTDTTAKCKGKNINFLAEYV